MPICTILKDVKNTHGGVLLSVKLHALRSFSIQLKFPRGQKILYDFRTEHVQSWHMKNRTEKDEIKKVENFQISWRILEK